MDSSKKSAVRKGVSYSSVAKQNDRTQTSSSSNSSVDSSKLEKLLSAFITILVATRGDRDPTVLLEKAVVVLTQFVPEMLDSAIVRSSMGLVVNTSAPGSSAKRARNSNNVDLPAQKC